MNREPILQTKARPKGEKRRRNLPLVGFVVGTVPLLLRNSDGRDRHPDRV